MVFKIKDIKPLLYVQRYNKKPVWARKKSFFCGIAVLEKKVRVDFDARTSRPMAACVLEGKELTNVACASKMIEIQNNKS